MLAFAWVWFAPCWLGGCAPVDELAEYQAEGSVLLDVHGEPFATLATVNRRVVPLDSMAPHLADAFLAVEDRRFYDHGGIDFRRVAGALVANVRAGGVAEGGSTITQQLARNLFPDWLPYTDRSLRRKVMEARVARQIERRFGKDKILELYLNHIYLGEGAYGVEAAARTYFGKPAAELDLAEAATLAALPKAPSELNPRANAERARERRDLVLAEMAEAGFIDRARAADARATQIQLAQAESEGGTDHAYFVERVRREMQQLIGSRFYTAGLRIHTTLDPTAQRAAEEELEDQLQAIEGGRFGAYRHPTYADARGEAAGSGRTPYLQGAAVLMDASSGAVRALVGGRDFDDSKFDRAVQALRQPGSAWKPFVYLTALERYRSPVRTVEDAPIRLASSGGRVWEPRNYTGSYSGTITLREALTRSKNTATVRLAQDVGIGPVIQNARRLGIEGEIPEVPATALGAAEVRPIELVQAYAAFANGGYRVEPHFIRRVESRRGATVWEADPRRERVIDPAVAFVLTSMLEDVVARGTGTAVRAAGFRGPAAGKTGTTNDATDVWFIGYTPELVGGIWIGLDEPQTVVRGASGGTLAAPVWGRVMRRVYQDRAAPAPWAAPPGVSQAEVERGTGRVVDQRCPATGPTYTEHFIGGAPLADCNPYPGYRGARADTVWGDEDWGAVRDPYAGGYADDTLRTPSREGVEWPELEQMRERIRVGAEADSPSDRTAPGQRPAPPEPAPSPAPQSRPAQPDPEPRARPGAQQPQLLGVPTRGDSAAPRRPAPPDTSTAGRPL